MTALHIPGEEEAILVQPVNENPAVAAIELFFLWFLVWMLLCRLWFVFRPKGEE